jgi:imidazolonepropionase-like amidohydrolase
MMPPYARAEHNVARLIAAGVCLLAGTDAPIPSTVYGRAFTASWNSSSAAD